MWTKTLTHVGGSGWPSPASSEGMLIEFERWAAQAPEVGSAAAPLLVDDGFTIELSDFGSSTRANH